jgi:predicted ATPase
MITRIEVNGFKTLSGFSLDFKPGLNILIGPNGAGKTNLVSFFEFLANLVEVEASEATSRVGGAGAVFRRLGADNYEKMITVQAYGCVSIPERAPQTGRTKRDERDRFIRYEYGFELQFPESRDAVLFSKQFLKTSMAKEFVTPRSPDYRSLSWQVEIVASLDLEGVPKASVKKLEGPIFDLSVSSSKNSKDEGKNLEAYLTGMLADNMSLIASLPRISYRLWLVAQDLRAGRVYNIVPSRIKLPEDSAKPSGIDRDGSGLSATLYAIQRSKEPEDMGPWGYYAVRPRRPREFSEATLDQLRSFLRIVNSSISDFSVSNDPFDNQLRVRFQIHSGDYKATVPLALMSDGTLKWIALVTAALTTQSVFSIEEPENYLHPQMQGQLVGILREILFREDEYRMTLMTTHSETLLNQCLPDELVIVGLDNGRTTAVRCSNAQQVMEEIHRTGFGLGYYYVTNALQDM